MVLSPRSIAVSPAGVRDVELVTGDGATITARLFVPDRMPRGTIVIHGATATPQRYYGRFAHYAASRMWRVVTYDYRGIGRSRPASLRGFPATMRQWADQDARAVFDWVRTSFRGPLMSIGHSFGGQLIGILDQARDVDRAVMVASQLGYIGHWPAAERWKLRAFWYGAVPLLTSIFGYLPGRAGIGEDLPSGVAREWARWCTSPGYLLDHVEDAAERVARFDAPTLLFSFTDDYFAPRHAVDALIDRLQGAPLAHRNVDPRELGVDRIGHFGFFRPAHRDTLWRQAIDFLGDGAIEELPPPPVDDRLWTVSQEEVMADLAYGR